MDATFREVAKFLSAACRADQAADKAAAAAAKEERLRVMQEKLAAWQASQAK